MEIKKENFNWYGFDHDRAKERYGDLDGNLEYIGTFCVRNEYKPSAVYYAPRPDKSKGHKNFVLFYKDPVLMTFFVTGMTAEEIKPYFEQEGVQCPSCAEVLYSVMRHDMRSCHCGDTFVDGGRDYVRTSAGAIPVIVDLLSGKAKKI